jgi:hypothetical protein
VRAPVVRCPRGSVRAPRVAALECVADGMRGAPSARRGGVSCDSWGAMFSLVTAVSGRNTPTAEALAHLVWCGLGFPYI